MTRWGLGAGVLVSIVGGRSRHDTVFILRLSLLFKSVEKVRRVVELGDMLSKGAAVGRGVLVRQDLDQGPSTGKGGYVTLRNGQQRDDDS